jgi:tetratricopeptide (TPR) repeat protein
MPELSAVTYRTLGDHLMMIGAASEAVGAYQVCRVLHSEGPVYLDKLQAADLVARTAAAMLLAGYQKSGFDEIARAREMGGDTPFIRYVRGFALHSAGAVAEAADLMQALARESAFSPWAEIALADFLPETVVPESLAALLQRAIEAAPHSGALHRRLAVVYVYLDGPYPVLAHARLGAWLDPHLERAWRQLGMTALKVKWLHDAARAFQSASNLALDDALIARCYLAAGHPDEAARQAQWGLDKEPQRDCAELLEQLRITAAHGTLRNRIGDLTVADWRSWPEISLFEPDVDPYIHVPR